jgi:hypothetical protein
MSGKTENALTEAFHKDHAILGRGFHELSTCLRAGELARARAVAERLDAEAGAHIAFEEEQFYPALVPLLGEQDVQRMYSEHGPGFEVVRTLCELPADARLSEAERAELLRQAEEMEAHITECGELFGAMGRIPPEEQSALYQELLEWRRKHTGWREYAETAARKPVGSKS